jgi:hypothetical protein
MESPALQIVVAEAEVDKVAQPLAQAEAALLSLLT